MCNGAAALADDVVVRVLVRRLVEGAILAEVRAEHEPVLDEHLERAVNGRGVQARQPPLDALDDLVCAQMAIAVGDEHVPDQPSLLCHTPAAGPQGYCRRRGLVAVIGSVHSWVYIRCSFAVQHSSTCPKCQTASAIAQVMIKSPTIM